MAKYLKKILSLCFLVVCALFVVSCENMPNKNDNHEHVECFVCGLCIDKECTGKKSEKCPGHEVDSHEHVVCPECGKCTDSECDGEEADKKYKKLHSEYRNKDYFLEGLQAKLEDILKDIEYYKSK